VSRDPAVLFARWGRQLLVDGVAVAGQIRLGDWAANLASDGSAVADAAAEAAGRYLVGGGLGRVVAGQTLAADLQALDPAMQTLASAAAATPPVAQYWFASRSYGFSVDAAVTDGATSAADWQAGTAAAARVVTLRVLLGQPAEPVDAVWLGALAADLLLADVLGLTPLPALVTVDWQQADAPHVDVVARSTAPEPPIVHALPAQILQLLAHQPDLQSQIDAECALRYPQEACGLLLQAPDGTVRCVVAPNLQDRYHALDPALYVRTARTAYKLNERLISKAGEAGESLLAIWHSHCDAGAYFSAEDVRSAAPDGQPAYPNVAYLVVSVMGGQVAAHEVYHFAPGPNGALFAAETHPAA
jgi:proteasome lid subunit RPN8/RPN11